MERPEAYQSGVNLGGWLSQYQKYDHNHFRTFITAADIQQIAGWGMDHVRLPVDYPVLEDDDQPFAYKESGFEYIENCLEWCRANGLKVILDLHKAPGFVFDNLGSSQLFQEKKLQDRFIELWIALAKRFLGKDGLVFELLNEIVLPGGSQPWNALASRAIEAIRSVDTERLIMVGGNIFNSPAYLKELEIPDDSNLFYTVHFYHPLVFTHQKAPWVPWCKEYNQTVEYPGRVQIPDEIAKKYGRTFGLPDASTVMELNKEDLRQALMPAVEYKARTGKAIYCGEYGAIEVAPMDSRIRWHRDFVDLLKEYGFGRAVWSYKLMDFSLVDAAGKVVNQELVRVVSQK